jgi:hypothetical protein
MTWWEWFIFGIMLGAVLFMLALGTSRRLWKKMGRPE